jgi:CheY-like chemotaxis protein
MVLTLYVNNSNRNPPDVHAAEKGQALRILVVDDDADTVSSMARLLRLYGHEVQTAREGPTAVQLAQACPPDVVLLDICMPKMDGFVVAKRFREQFARKRPLVIAITGYQQARQWPDAAKVGIDLFLLKPVDPEGLRQLLVKFRTLIRPPD